MSSKSLNFYLFYNYYFNIKLGVPFTAMGKNFNDMIKANVVWYEILLYFYFLILNFYDSENGDNYSLVIDVRYENSEIAIASLDLMYHIILFKYIILFLLFLLVLFLKIVYFVIIIIYYFGFLFSFSLVNIE